MFFRALLFPLAVGAACLLAAGTSPATAQTVVLAEPDALVLVDGRHRGRGYDRRHWRGPPPRYYGPPPRRYRPPPVYYAPPPVYYAPPPRYYRPPPPRYYSAPPPGVGLYFRF
ncbi:hypothetical protein [Falsiroseomonas sp. E2-1-a4]|uniref:hypothetical protein n=1 Tax=Falsiroseomonas sp. E2-1-a4 TaxID=3239299 RepID=UPI003F406F94